jgi:hypothetical protein
LMSRSASARLRLASSQVWPGLARSSGPVPPQRLAVPLSPHLFSARGAGRPEARTGYLIHQESIHEDS